MKKRALIFGVSGQDGSYLAELLLKEGYEVFGTLRRHSVAENQDARLNHINELGTFYGDLLDEGSVRKAIDIAKPDEVYNLAAQSHVGISSKMPAFTLKVNALGVLHILEALRSTCPAARMYQASSSEMFGNSHEVDWSQNENTPMLPVSPYGIAKLSAYHLVRHYRKGHGLFACNGICFNHSSVRRGANFVEQKIIKAAILIANGEQESIELGRIDSQRDWGWAPDYVDAMRKILQYAQPDDYVISTGVTRSVRNLAGYVFDKVGLDFDRYWKKSEDFYRPEELTFLRGDSKKIRERLGWQPTKTFESMIDEMIEYWEQKYASGELRGEKSSGSSSSRG